MITAQEMAEIAVNAKMLSYEAVEQSIKELASKGLRTLSFTKDRLSNDTKERLKINGFRLDDPRDYNYVLIKW